MLDISPRSIVLLVTFTNLIYPIFLGAIIKNRNYRKIPYIIAALVCVAPSVYYVSRVGILAVTFSTSFLLWSYTSHKKRIYIFLWISFMLILATALYELRPESVKGRLLIYEVILSAVKDHLLTGYGHNAMYRYYMLHQAEYLNAHCNCIYENLADNVYYTYNEFLGILYRYGIFAFLAACVFCTYLFLKAGKILKSSLISLFIICMFSYPFSAISPHAKTIENIYEKAAYCNVKKNYTGSNKILRHLRKEFINYDTELLTGDNYLQLKDYDNAIKYFTTAHNMIPSRFYPLYGLFLCYKETNVVKAKETALKIINKDIKIPSKDIQMIIEETEYYIGKQDASEPF